MGGLWISVEALRPHMSAKLTAWRQRRRELDGIDFWIAFCNNLAMTFAPDADPHLAEALAQAERRRAMLEELAEIGMNLARDVGAHAAAAMSAINEDNGGDPTRAFATVSRAVRLTLAMEARLDAQILALRNGKTPAGWGGTCPTPPRTKPTPANVGLDAEEPGREGPGALRERLVDREAVEAFLGQPFEACLEAICRELRVGLPGDAEAVAGSAGEGAGGPAQAPPAQPGSANPVLRQARLAACATAGPPAPSPASSALALAVGAHRRE